MPFMYLDIKPLKSILATDSLGNGFLPQTWNIKGHSLVQICGERLCGKLRQSLHGNDSILERNDVVAESWDS